MIIYEQFSFKRLKTPILIHFRSSESLFSAVQRILWKILQLGHQVRLFSNQNILLLLPLLFSDKECRFHFQLSFNNVLSCYHIFKSNSVVRLKYGTTPDFFSHVTNIKY